MEKYNPKISIIMPSLNVFEFIEECIESVVTQSLKDIEIICVDAGSTDGTLEILKKYEKKDERVKLIQTNIKSYGYQVNLGIDHANGDYIGIVETDDFIDKKMYESLYNLTNNGLTDISKVNFYHYYDSDPNDISFRVDESKKGLPNHEFTILDYPSILEGHPCIWAAIYKKNMLIENNIRFMEVPGGGWVDNPFLFETFICAKSITYSEEPFYYYRELNPNSSTNSLSDLTLPMRRMLDIFDVLDKYSYNYEDILSTFYIRVFWHVYDITSNYDFGKQKIDVLFYLSHVLKKLDEKIVLTYFEANNLKRYYKYLNDDSNFGNTIKNYNLIIEKYMDNNKLEDNLELFNKKIETIFMRYGNISPNFKKEAYYKIREDFLKIFSHKFYETFISNLSQKNIKKFQITVESLSFEEFDFEYNNLKLENENKKLSNEIKKLKNDIKKSNKLTNQILKSKSWKVTKPLRDIKNH